MNQPKPKQVEVLISAKDWKALLKGGEDVPKILRIFSDDNQELEEEFGKKFQGKVVKVRISA